jgi:hypothetical protein
VEPAADEVVHPARGHPVEGGPRHCERALVAAAVRHAQEELERRVGRKLGRAAESAPFGIEQLGERGRGPGEETTRERLGRGLAGARVPDRLGEDVGLPREVGPALAVRVGDRGEHLPEARQAVTRLGREVRAAPEGPAVRREEDRQRPAAVSGQRDHRLHVEAVHVRPLLAVDLDRDEVLVHERGGLGVLEGLVLHDVAPVTRGVADGEEDRLVLVARAREGLVAPGVPVHRVVGVLEQVGARLGCQAVGHYP